MTELELKIYDIVRGIPAGRVATYGQVALAAGDRRLARVVGNVMHKNPVPFWELGVQVGWKPCEVGKRHCKAGKKPCEAGCCGGAPAGFAPVPCHRVVNASGKMGANFGMGGPEVQAAMLRAEGVEVGADLRIADLERFAANL